MFDRIKQINELRKKSKELEKELAGEVIEVNYKGVIVKISANLQLIDLQSQGRSDQEVLEAVNKDLKEAQKLAAKKMRGQLGDLGLNIPGL